MLHCIHGAQAACSHSWVVLPRISPGCHVPSRAPPAAPPAGAGVPINCTIARYFGFLILRRLLALASLLAAVLVSLCLLQVAPRPYQAPLPCGVPAHCKDTLQVKVKHTHFTTQTIECWFRFDAGDEVGIICEKLSTVAKP